MSCIEPLLLILFVLLLLLLLLLLLSSSSPLLLLYIYVTQVSVHYLALLGLAGLNSTIQKNPERFNYFQAVTDVSLKKCWFLVHFLFLWLFKAQADMGS